MAAEDEFQGSGNWWDTARNVRFESGASSSQTSSSSSSSSSAITNMGNYAWQLQRSSMDSLSSSSVCGAADSSNTDPNLHMMALGLSSQPMDWNQASLLRGEKGREKSSLGAMLEENMRSGRSNFEEESEMGLWRTEKMLFSDSSSTGLLEGVLLGHENNQQGGICNSFENGPFSRTSSSFTPELELELVPQFLRDSLSPKQQLQLVNNNHLHFTNKAPFWNASEGSSPIIKDGVRSSFLFPSLQQPPFSTTKFEYKVRELISTSTISGGVGKKSEAAVVTPKRSRNQTPSPLPPAFKVRKQKMGDRITALQQLVSPFGKTDTASVLSEAIEYIKFLHEQVTALSTPYMKSGAPTHFQQSCGKLKESEEGPKQDLRSRGLCLVPVSSTFPVTHESTVDFWTPTFGATPRS